MYRVIYALRDAQIMCAWTIVGTVLKNDRGLETIGDLTNNFSVLKKCNGKIFHNEDKALNTQWEYKRGKLFI